MAYVERGRLKSLEGVCIVGLTRSSFLNVALDKMQLFSKDTGGTKSIVTRSAGRCNTFDAPVVAYSLLHQLYSFITCKGAAKGAAARVMQRTPAELGVEELVPYDRSQVNMSQIA